MECPRCKYPAANQVMGCLSCGWMPDEPVEKPDPKMAPKALASIHPTNATLEEKE